MPATANMRDGFNYDWVGARALHAFQLLHDETCKFANYLHEDKFVYALYGVLDGLSLSYSTTKYWFDMMVSLKGDNKITSSDLMHNAMLTPLGIAATLAETIILVVFSYYANVIDDEERFQYLRHEIKISDDTPVKEEQLCLYLDNGIIRCKVKNKKGVIENFTINDGELGDSAEEIKEVIRSCATLTKDHLEKIREATTTRNDVQTRYNIYVGFRYVRDLLKALKNSYKGIRATMWAANWLKTDMRVLLFPTALTFGLIAAANRIWYRAMKEHRKMLQTFNKNLASQIRSLEQLSEEDAANFLGKIGFKSIYSRAGGLLSQAFGGLIDGMYLYMGALMLAPVLPLAFTFLLTCSSLFVVLCIVTRMYTEYEYQRKLVSSELMVKLTICGKRMESLFSELQSESVMGNDASSEPLNLELKQEMDQFKLLQNELWESSLLTPTMVVLAGLRDGLAASGAVGSLMFVTVTILAMAAVPCPPAFIVACMLASLALLMTGLTYAMATHWSTSINPPEKSFRYTEIRLLLDELKSSKVTVQNLDLEIAKKKIWKGLIIDPSPQSFWQEWGEFLRAILASIAKAQKGVDFTFNPLQEVDENGHYSDSKIMMCLSVVFGIFFMLGFGGRSIAREFSGKESASSNALALSNNQETVLPQNLTMADDLPSAPPDSAPLTCPTLYPKHHHFSSLFNVSNNSLSNLGLFKTKLGQPSLRRARSDGDLVNMKTRQQITRDDSFDLQSDSPSHFI